MKWIDLGLESGTLWGSDNVESSNVVQMCDIIKTQTFPTKMQYQELLTLPYKFLKSNSEEIMFEGKNGNILILPQGVYVCSSINHIDNKTKIIYYHALLISRYKIFFGIVSKYHYINRWRTVDKAKLGLSI